MASNNNCIIPVARPLLYDTVLKSETMRFNYGGDHAVPAWCCHAAKGVKLYTNGVAGVAEPPLFSN